MITEANIWDVMKSDFAKRFGGLPLKAEVGTRATIERLAGEYQPEFLRQMWCNYLDNESEERWGLTVENFVKPVRINTYAAQLAKTRKGYGNKYKAKSYTLYKCENYLRDAITGEFIIPVRCHYEILSLQTGDYNVRPCPICEARLMREDLWFEENTRRFHLLESKGGADLTSVRDVIESKRAPKSTGDEWL